MAHMATIFHECGPVWRGTIQLALSGLLRREGYEVALASTGEDAVALQRENAFDLVLTDLALGPGASGMD